MSKLPKKLWSPVTPILINVGLSLLLRSCLVASTLDIGLVANFRFNGDFADNRGNLSNAANYGSSFTNDRFGNSDSALSINGAQYALINGLGTVLTNATSGVTVSGWYKSSKEFFSGFIQNNFANPSPSPALRIGVYNGGKVYGNLGLWGTYPGGPYNDMVSQEIFSFNTWHQIIGVIEFGQTPRFYLDGEPCYLTSNLPVINAPFIFDSPFALGTSFEGGVVMTDINYIQNGAIDDLLFFNRPLSDSEAKSLYQTQSVPEPSALSLLAVGFGGLAMMRRRRS